MLSQPSHVMRHTLAGFKGQTHKGHRENVLKIVNFRAFSMCFQGISREKNPPPKPPTPIVNSFRGCSCKLSSLFPLDQTRCAQKAFWRTVCGNCFQLGLLGWVVFWGGFFSLEYLGNWRNTVSRVLFRRRQLTEPH